MQPKRTLATVLLSSSSAIPSHVHRGIIHDHSNFSSPQGDRSGWWNGSVIFPLTPVALLFKLTVRMVVSMLADSELEV
jgi:hypothetical protein